MIYSKRVNVCLQLKPMKPMNPKIQTCLLNCLLQITQFKSSSETHQSEESEKQEHVCSIWGVDRLSSRGRSLGLYSRYPSAGMADYSKTFPASNCVQNTLVLPFESCIRYPSYDEDQTFKSWSWNSSILMHLGPQLYVRSIYAPLELWAGLPVDQEKNNTLERAKPVDLTNGGAIFL